MIKQMSKAYDALKRRFASKGATMKSSPDVMTPSIPDATLRKLKADGPWMVFNDKTDETLGDAERLYPELATTLNKPPLRWKDGGAAP